MSVYIRIALWEKLRRDNWFDEDGDSRAYIG